MPLILHFPSTPTRNYELFRHTGIFCSFSRHVHILHSLTKTQTITIFVELGNRNVPVPNFPDLNTQPTLTLRPDHHGSARQHRRQNSHPLGAPSWAPAPCADWQRPSERQNQNRGCSGAASRPRHKARPLGWLPGARCGCARGPPPPQPRQGKKHQAAFQPCPAPELKLLPSTTHPFL